MEQLQFPSENCFNGVLSGTYAHGSCAVKQAQSCSFNGQIINDGIRNGLSV